MDESTTWLKKIEPAILENLDMEGQNSAPPTFPLADLAQKIKTNFHIDDLELSIGTCEWKAQKGLLSGLGQTPISLTLEMTPLEGALFWIMATEDIEKLVSWMKFGEGNEMKINHPELLKGIYRFVALEVVDMAYDLKLFNDLSLKLADKIGFDETAYAIDISIKKGSDVVWGRLALSPAFKHSFTNHYAIKRVTLKDLKNKFEDLFLQLSMNVGDIELTQEEIEGLKEGDFLIPDALHYSPKHERGNVRVMLGEKALFVAKPKENHIKLMDFIYAYEETPNG